MSWMSSVHTDPDMHMFILHYLRGWGCNDNGVLPLSGALHDLIQDQIEGEGTPFLKTGFHLSGKRLNRSTIVLQALEHFFPVSICPFF